MGAGDREQAAEALAHAVGDLRQVLEYADEAGDVFGPGEYPAELPELGELVAALAGVRLADLETMAGRYGRAHLVLEAWEIDGGPGGIYWEVSRPGAPTLAIVGSRREAEALGASVLHTLEEWEEAELEAEAEREAAERWPSGTRAGLIGPETGARWAPAGDRMAELEARVGRLERLAEDERSGKAER